jgi:hypothetical protein
VVAGSQTAARSKTAIDRLIARRRQFKPSPDAIAEITRLLAPRTSG